MAKNKLKYLKAGYYFYRGYHIARFSRNEWIATSIDHIHGATLRDCKNQIDLTISMEGIVPMELNSEHNAARQ